MAAKSDLKWRVGEIATCPICLEHFDNPKSLPCVHSFCLNCIQRHCAQRSTNKELPNCPVCRKAFRIPANGLGDLPGNFFIQNLLDAREATKEKAVGVPCEACPPEDAGDAATVYCVDCSQKLCERCSWPHKRMRNGGHLVEPLGSELMAESMRKRSSLCSAHTDESVKLYCFTCEVNICGMCFFVAHREHNCREISKVSDEFLKQMETDDNHVSALNSGLKSDATLLKNKKSEFLSDIAKAQAAVDVKVDTVKRLLDMQAKELSDILQTVKVTTLKAVSLHEATYEQAALDIESYNTCCLELRTYGRQCDVTHGAPALHTRASELLETYQTTSPEINTPCVIFSQMNIDELATGEHNLIGRITVRDKSESGDETPTELRLETKREKQLMSLLQKSMLDVRLLEDEIRLMKRFNIYTEQALLTVEDIDESLTYD